MRIPKAATFSPLLTMTTVDTQSRERGCQISARAGPVKITCITIRAIVIPIRLAQKQQGITAMLQPTGVLE
ncbi:hypothetical protein FGO68_gene17526 [Halteria grandinella]|uniref:Uncharacterized protein n=1 Tax=Halteria grandinella TaxID=5974 RepID=A0A8J8P6R5_HALGN|nr:hypothetical protein FGO68_gene17526 [Halteria grandinella]